MYKTLFVPGGLPGGERELGNLASSKAELAGLRHAYGLAVAGAITHGVDLPVGAVAMCGGEIVGSGIASDVRLGNPGLHAEVMAVVDAASVPVDTLVVTLEPCYRCQDFLAKVPGLARVFFGVPRDELEVRELLRPHGEHIADRARRVELPFAVAQIDHPETTRFGLAVLDAVLRDYENDMVVVDQKALAALVSDTALPG